IENVSPLPALSGMHHCTSVRTESVRCGLVGVTVMSITGLGIVAARTGFATATPMAPPNNNTTPMNFEPVALHSRARAVTPRSHFSVFERKRVAGYPRPDSAKPDAANITQFSP